MGEKSPGHDMRPKHPHCAARAAGMLLDHLVADVRSARAGTPWLQRWTAHASAHVYYTRRCVGRECIAAGAPGACTAGCVAGSPGGLSIPPLAHTPPPFPSAGGVSGHAAPVHGGFPTVSGPSSSLPQQGRYRTEEEGSSPLLNVPVPPDEGAPTDLATLLAGIAAPERRGDDPLCNGQDCARCARTGVRCPCAARRCGGKQPNHKLQPVESRRGLWPPPEFLLVALARARRGDVKHHTRVVVPEGTFAVLELFAKPPDSPGGPWQPSIAHYSTQPRDPAVARPFECHSLCAL